MRYYVPLSYRAICKLTYMFPYRDDNLLIYVNDSNYHNMREYFDLFGNNYYSMIGNAKRNYKPFNKTYGCRSSEYLLYRISDHYKEKFVDKVRIKKPLNIKKNMCYSIGTTKATLQDTIMTYLGRIT